jgi:hypothetical protein
MIPWPHDLDDCVGLNKLHTTPGNSSIQHLRLQRHRAHGHCVNWKTLPTISRPVGTCITRTDVAMHKSSIGFAIKSKVTHRIKRDSPHNSWTSLASQFFLRGRCPSPLRAKRCSALSATLSRTRAQQQSPRVQQQHHSGTTAPREGRNSGMQGGQAAPGCQPAQCNAPGRGAAGSGRR